MAITARPSYSRIRSALVELERDPSVDLSILCSGSSLLDRYGRVVDLIKADGFNVCEEIYTYVEGNEPINMAMTVSATISQTSAALKRMNPDFVVSIADRYETLGTAVSASYLGVPLIHIQGGEITGNIDEKVRHAVSKLADYHLVANANARNRLIKMGEHPDTVFDTGCPSIDIANAAQNLDYSEVRDAVNFSGVGAEIDLDKPFLVMLQHPDTDSHESAFDQVQATLDAVMVIDMPTLIFWPNVDAGSDAVSKCLRVNRERKSLENVRFIKNLEGHIFLRLLMQAQALIGNSSVGLRECAYLGVPTVNIGNRQNGRDRAENVIDVHTSSKAIERAARLQIEHGKYPRSHLYGSGQAGLQIAQTISGLNRVIKGKVFYEE